MVRYNLLEKCRDAALRLTKDMNESCRNLLAMTLLHIVHNLSGCATT